MIQGVGSGDVTVGRSQIPYEIISIVTSICDAQLLPFPRECVVD